MGESKKTKKAADKTATGVSESNVNLQVADSKKGEVKKVEAKKEVEENSSSFDKILWILSFALLALAIGGNYYYTQYIMLDEGTFERLGRVALVIAIILVALVVLLFTNRGKKLLAFAKESYVELRKVVWPTRQEALQTTFIVFIAVSVVSVFLYLCDLIFLQIVRLVTL